MNKIKYQIYNNSNYNKKKLIEIKRLENQEINLNQT
jgi:hypothetical protein